MQPWCLVPWCCRRTSAGDPPLRSRTAREADGKNGPVGSCPEGDLLSQFQHMLCSQGFCWIPETTWGFPLAGAVLLLLWLGFEIWTSSCLARWQAQLRRPVATESHAAQPSPPPLPEAACEEETDFPATQAKHSSCICGRQLTSDFESYELPCQVHRHPYEPYQTPRSLCQDENLYQKYLPCLPPLLRATMILPKHSSSSSSSSSGSSSCLPLLKHLNLCCRVATDTSQRMHDSSDASEASSSDSFSSESEDLYFLKKKKQRGPSFIPLFPERLPEIKGAPLLPESHPEIKGVPQTSFAQINIVQSSTFEKEDHVILVEKSLEIRMGPLPAPTAPGSLPRLRIQDKEEAAEKPSPLPLLDQMAIQCLDLRVKEQKGELAKTTEKSAPKPSSEKEEEPLKVTTDPVSALPPDSEEVPTVLKGMDEKSRNFLEFHIKKKMVQRRCGVPTVVINSVNLFQSVKKKSFRGDLKKTMQNVLLIPSDAEAPAHPPLLPRNAMAVYMKSFQEPPRAKEYHIFHKANPEEIRKVAFPAPEEKLGLKPRDFQRSQRNEVLFSVEPEKLQKLLFHLTVKMVEIQKGAFPEMVEDSLRTFSILSVKPLPKLIRFGNKISRPKHLSLTFVAKEALCIIDFNISHKYMVFTWGIETLHSKPTEKTIPGLSKATQCSSSPEKGVPQKPPVPILVLKIPRKGASTSRGPESKQILLIPKPPKPQGPRIVPLAPAEEPRDVQFTDLFKQSCLAPSAPSKKAEGPPPRSLALPLRNVPIQETEAPGDRIQPKKASLAMPCPKSQGAAGKDSPSTRQEAPGEKMTDGKIRTLKAANLQEELQDRPTGLPAPLKEGEKAEGEEAGSKKDGDQQGEPYRGLPPTFQKGAGAGRKKEADEQAEPYRAVPPSPEKGASKRDGDEQGELEGTMHHTPTRAGTGSKRGENQQAELEGTMHYRALPVPAAERGASKRDGDDWGELEGTMRYRAPSETPEKGATTGSQRDADRPADLEGRLRYASTGAGARSKKDRDAQAELEGTLHYRALPPSAEKGAKEEHRPAELEGTMRCSPLPQPAAEAGRAAAEGAGSAQRFPARESKAGAQADGKGAAGLKEGRKGRERAPRGDALSLSVGLQAAGSQRDATATRASLFLRLHLTREKLHLRLHKRLEAALRPRQRAGLSLRVETGAGKRRGPPPARPFCYACPVPESRGAAGRTVCWALPQRILDMSGGRVPQVARPERRHGEPRRGGPRRPARRRRGAGQGRPGEAAPGVIKPFA
ncbi:uncharacterized protein LOC117679474 [Pantherophis guttatus]|uniref:Uncharacterized protein LOC117679474 n=1 Tax=Pantherophis guttatus TaxID=94885 RepID=A0A6P9DNC6_PANGU|nr:uncharacterized protein LOC117679474 [Pantherophis guttatus]